MNKSYKKGGPEKDLKHISGSENQRVQTVSNCKSGGELPEIGGKVVPPDGEGWLWLTGPGWTQVTPAVCVHFVYSYTA